MNETKKHIILVASMLFLQKSFKEVTMNEIIKKTGLSKGAFYHYFESKEQLFLVVIEHFLQNYSHNYESYSRESLYQSYTDYMNETVNLTRNYVKSFSESYKDEMEENVFTMNYFSLIFDAIKLFPEFKEKLIKGFNKEIDYWTKAVKRAREKGEIKSSMSDKEIGEMFMYLSDGVGIHMILRGADIENMVKPFIKLWDKFYMQIKA